MSSTILIADDEHSIVQLTKLYLSNEGFTVYTAWDGQEALDAARRLKPAMIVLDLMMPKVDGWEVCRRLRRESTVPIIMLTARDDDEDKIGGLDLGADDYLTKPFNPRELVARIKAILRRAQEPADPDAALEVGDVRLDPARREARVAGKPVPLRTQEFELLRVLAKHAGRVMTREALLSQAWGYDYLGESRTVDMHVAALREKLQGSSTRIESVRGYGYKLVEPPEAPPAGGTPAGTAAPAGRPAQGGTP
ncbi:MAG TPA: response regulator transcription factor [Chloroflexota bacterium]|nr:response regulator transcription factor [Chloroflexota bacterium]